MVERLFDRIIYAITALKYLYLRLRVRVRIWRNATHGEVKQNLAVYSDPKFIEAASAWGVGTAWSEIQYLLLNCRGKVLDIACGPCTVLTTVRSFIQCDVYGCDVSEYLIGHALKAGVPRSRLVVCDATRTPYHNDAFDFSYSIGSLEHFTEEGISCVVRESHRITRHASFHQVPTSRSGRNEGWIELQQSYFNNSVSWWLEKFKTMYETVYVLDSRWEDGISVGKWFVCIKP